MQFSKRTAWELEENAFTESVRKARTAGQELLDLTVANPTACGFAYDAEKLLSPLAEPRALLYAPDALGMLRAREAVAEYYANAVDVQRICLTTSTSEAYSFLFRLLCDADDEVLVATPSYPLFEFIAGLDDVRLVAYPLLYHDGWQIDFHALEAAITERNRALVVVHPNNPTGQFCSFAERAQLREMCVRRGLALVVDEVFLDYEMDGCASESFLRETSEALTFVLSGISKVCGLPQMKCSWIAAAGPVELVAEAMARLEVVADTFLSMNAPVQYALPAWLGARAGIQGQIRARCAENLRAMDTALAGSGCERLVMEAGWTAVLRVPRVGFAEAALKAGVVVQPGSFYGLGEGRAVVSLLTLPEVWKEGVRRLAEIGGS